MSRALAACVAAVAMVWVPIACVSERTAGPGVDLEGCNVELPSDAFGSAIVVIRNFNFVPADVRVRPGTKVTWVNCDTPGSESHTSTADGGAWSSSLLPPGTTFTQVFGTAGAFPYHCEPHPTMRGTVTVE